MAITAVQTAGRAQLRRRTLSVCGVVIGLFLSLIGLIGVLDPVGTRHADDVDPFGTPGGRLYPASIMVVGAALIVWPLLAMARDDIG